MPNATTSAVSSACAPSAVAVVDVAAQFGFGDDAEDLVLVIGLSRALGRLIW